MTAKEYRDRHEATIRELATQAFAHHQLSGWQQGPVTLYSAKRHASSTHWFQVVRVYPADNMRSVLLIQGDFGNLVLERLGDKPLETIAGWDLGYLAQHVPSEMPVKEFDPDLCRLVLQEAILDEAKEGAEWANEPAETGKRVHALASALTTLKEYDCDAGVPVGNLLCQSEANFEGEEAFGFVSSSKLYTPAFLWGIEAIRWLAEKSKRKEEAK